LQFLIYRHNQYQINAKKLAIKIREETDKDPSQLKKNILLQTVENVIGSATAAAEGNRMGPANYGGTSAAAASSASASGTNLLATHSQASSGSSTMIAAAAVQTENKIMPHSYEYRLAKLMSRKSDSHAGEEKSGKPTK
jgi:hypothetical protein